MNKIIVKMYDLEGDQITIYTILTGEKLTYPKLKQIALNRLNKQLGSTYRLEEITFDILDVTEDINVIDLTKEN